MTTVEYHARTLPLRRARPDLEDRIRWSVIPFTPLACALKILDIPGLDREHALAVIAVNQ